MFTFGIFSSYIPYAAIAIFYVWYLCFGAVNVDSPENETTEKFSKTEILTQTSPNHDQAKAFNYSNYTCNKNQNYQYEITYSQTIVSWPEYRSPDLNTIKHGFKLFSRPPPVV